ncbi:hypothetical protein ABBQ38_004698 [Trebouxia sp. C0009 RCD-2024]
MLGYMLQALRKDNVKVVLIHPGPVATSMTKGRFDPELALEADDVAEAALLPLRTTALCVLKEMTLDCSDCFLMAWVLQPCKTLNARLVAGQLHC